VQNKPRAVRSLLVPSNRMDRESPNILETEEDD